MKIHLVRTQKEALAVRMLVRDFITFLKTRYPERIQLIDDYFKDQGLEEELDNLLTYFNPPDGECLLGYITGLPAGIVMLKRISDTDCEMNRMYVTDAARGRGLGRKMCETLIEQAREMGYSVMRLDALDRHVEAVPLYESLGFISDTASKYYGEAGIVPMMLEL